MTVWCVFCDNDLLSIHMTEKSAQEKLEWAWNVYQHSTVFVEEREVEQ